MGENIGAAARVMHNFGLNDLRLVAPRDGWPNQKATETARNAQQIITDARVYPELAPALTGVQYLLAATARPRDMVKRMLSPRQALKELAERSASGQACGLMFGPERSGLANEDLILADTLVSIPVNPEYPSLNLAQSVAILCYEWRMATEGNLPSPPALEPPASKDEISGFFSHLTQILDEVDFFKVPEKRERMLHNIHNLFTRAEMNSQDVRTLRGILTALGRK